MNDEPLNEHLCVEHLTLYRNTTTRQLKARCELCGASGEIQAMPVRDGERTASQSNYDRLQTEAQIWRKAFEMLLAARYE